MHKYGGWRLWLAGVLCGMIFMAVGNVLVGWKPSSVRSAQDDAIYDRCLMAQAGNTTACEAMMRVLDRERIAEAAMLKEAAKMLAAGVSKHDVVKWAADRGFVGSQLSDSVGITLEELRSGKY